MAKQGGKPTRIHTERSMIGKRIVIPVMQWKWQRVILSAGGGMRKTAILNNFDAADITFIGQLHRLAVSAPSGVECILHGIGK